MIRQNNEAARQLQLQFEREDEEERQRLLEIERIQRLEEIKKKDDEFAKKLIEEFKVEDEQIMAKDKEQNSCAICTDPLFNGEDIVF